MTSNCESVMILHCCTDNCRQYEEVWGYKKVNKKPNKSKDRQYNGQMKNKVHNTLNRNRKIL
jgi:hypothetical protein